jgi:hypothetical protein
MNTAKKFQFENLPQDFSPHKLPEILKLAKKINGDTIIRYRATEMLRLIDNIGKIAEFDYPLMLRTLDRVETTPDEKLTFLFQSGIRITV